MQMQKKKMKNLCKKLLVEIQLILLVLVLSCCKSSPINTNYIPDLYFPSFPSLIDTNGNVVIEPVIVDGNVIAVKLPYNYWLQILVYVNDVEAVYDALHPP